MPHPLEQKLVLIRARVRRLVAVYGLSWLVAVTLATVLMLGLADYVFRFEDRGLRVLAWLAMLSAFGWTAYRHLYVPLAVRLGDVEIARRIERRFPQFHDGLASAVQFVRQPEDDPTAGSVALRRAVVARVAAEAEGLDFGQVIEPRPVWRALAAAAVAVLLAVSLALWDPGSARTALTRLANPLSDVTWPQLYHLMVRNPVDRIARGGDFEVIVVDRYRRKLPREVYIHYRFENPDGTVAEETRPMRFTGEAMVDRREQVTRSFSYRAEGGDDHSMGWHRVEVLDPPAVDRITVTVRPPEYTGWPPVRSDGPIRALAGSGVEIEARTTKPLRSATLCLEDGRRLAAAVSEDGYQFRSPPPGGETLVLDQSGAYWFELIDRDGLPGGRQRWPIHAVPDSPPTVRIDSPTANLFVTPQATVQVVVAANDDLALRRIVLRAARGDQVEDSAHAIQLFAGPEGPPARPSGLGAQRTEPDRRVVNYAWDLTPFDLQPGDRVTFVATATDYRPQSADSAPRRLVVITPEELADHIAARQSAVLSELARALEIQRQSRSRVAGAEIRLDETGRLDQLDVDRLQGAELSQRQVTRILTSPSDGVPMHIRGLLADLENNHLESPDVQRQMHELLATIEALKKEHLTTIAHRLTSVIKAAQILLDGSTGEPETEPGQQQRPARPDPTVARPLAAAGQHQDAVIATLEELLGQLSRWADYRRFHRHLSQLLREQEAVSDRTTQLARSTLAQEVDDLPPHQVAELRTAARDQRELARRLDRILQEMSQAVEKIRDVDPLAADNIADAVYEARQQAVSAQMQSAGSHVAANRMGQAMRLQETVREGLRQMLDILANRRETELERLVEKLREAEDQLAELAGREEKLRGQAEAAADQADEQARRRKLEELRGEQERLREETERMARQLERLMADRASRTTARAAQAMEAAERHARQADARRAAEQAWQAKKELQEARRQLAQALQQAEAELALEQFARLEDVLGTVRGRQQAVLEETQRLDRLAKTQGSLTRGQLASLRDVSREQQMLRDRLTALADDLQRAPVFHLTLTGTANDMDRAVQALEDRLTGPPAQQAQRQALARLDRLLEAIQPQQPEPGEQQGGPAGGAGNRPGGASAAETLQALAELKLLKFMQEDLNERTRQLEEAFGGRENLDRNARRQYEQLGHEQGRLADLLLRLLPPEPGPESLLEDLPIPENESP